MRRASNGIFAIGSRDVIAHWKAVRVFKGSPRSGDRSAISLLPLMLRFSSVFVVKRRKMPHLYSTLQGTVVTGTFSLVHVHVTILWMRGPVLVLNFTARQFF